MSGEVCQRNPRYMIFKVVGSYVPHPTQRESPSNITFTLPPAHRTIAVPADLISSYELLAVSGCAVHCFSTRPEDVQSVIRQNDQIQVHPYCTFEAGRAAATAFFLGCVASPFFKSSGMMSAALERLMNFRHTGHCERFCSPGPARFSPAMRASIKQVWQKR
jgi:hypothetical protein